MKTLLAVLICIPPSFAAAESGTMNQLAKEKSPYLAQHAENPVDWYPWGDEAFAKAAAEDKPIFLSIGYATCHWCHVMERESFADPKVAAIMNKHYVSVKVDREERPDVDKIYMSAATGAGWGGGWPLSIWLTPDRKPFFGGTYFPPEPRWGQPGFAPLLERIGELWAQKKEDISKDAATLADALRSSATVVGREAKPDAAWLGKAFDVFAAGFDAEHGGFGRAPKFPMPAYQGFLLRHHARTGEKRALEMVRTTLDKMAAGGIYDQVGGGFHRYSTDPVWHVPHFEKMLYDNAQLAVNYLEAYQAGRDPEHARVARETLDYVLREMTHPEGGFYSAQDADSLPAGEKEGHKAEGAFYVWTSAELEKLLGSETAKVFAYRYGVEPGGNAAHDPHGEFAGKNILYAAHTVKETAAHFGKTPGETGRLLDGARLTLRQAREKRPHPFLDDKVLASWNGLMIGAFAKGAQALEEPAYAASGAKAAVFVRAKLYDPKSKRLYHRWRDGERSVDGIADDYAFLLSGLLDLYEATFDPQWLDWAEELAGTMRTLFYDEKRGGYFMTAKDGGKDLLYRVLEDSDGVEPSASSAAASALLRLAQFTDRKDLRADAEKTLERFGTQLRDHPRSLAAMLHALDLATAKPKQVVIAGPPEDPGTREMLRLVYSRFLPGKILIQIPDDATRKRLAKRLPALAGMGAVRGKATAYVCVNYACELPTSDLEEMARALDGKTQ